MCYCHTSTVLFVSFNFCQKMASCFLQGIYSRPGRIHRSKSATLAYSSHHMHLLASAPPTPHLTGSHHFLGRFSSRLHVHIEKYSYITVITGITISRCDGHLCTAVQLFVAKIFKVCDAPLHIASTTILLLVFLGPKRFSLTRKLSHKLKVLLS